MPYKDGSWGPQAKAKSKQRLEYFKKYQKEKYGHKHTNRQEDLNIKDSLGTYGEKIFLKLFDKATWIGKDYDACWLGEKIDVKTSSPTKTSGGKDRWKFHLKRQRGKVDTFVLFCVDENRTLKKLIILPDKDLTVDDISINVGSQKSKYLSYAISL